MRRAWAGAILALSATMTGCGISTQQEQQMGAEYAAQINAQLPIVQDAEINRYVNVLGDSIARLTSRGAELDWRFYVVNAAEVNAFAVPGGYIYVNRGLIDRTTTMSQLAGVLGHEIGHVVRRHSVKQMEKAQGANIGVALACTLTSVCNSQVGQAAIQVGGSALFARFSRQDEAEADQEAIANTVRAGIDPRGIPEMFQILLNERNQNGGDGGAVAGWFATHPGEEDRIRDTQATISQISPAVLRTLTRNTSNFAAFKARVRSLPAPPPQQGQ
jgi:predicted Zn-dependent protease